MKRHEHLLDILAEECCEVAVRASKAMRFTLSEIQPGQPSTNAQRLMDEIHDVFAMVELLEEEGLIRSHSDEARAQAIAAKKEKVERFLELSRKEGTLEE